MCMSVTTIGIWRPIFALAPFRMPIAMLLDVGKPFEAWAAYEQVTVVAWSFGCAVAAQCMARHSWPVQEALAINGTVTPEDDEVGIPRRWMDATAESLLQGGWPKFVRRMCLDQVGSPGL